MIFLDELEKRFEEIDKSEEPIRTKRLTNLLRDMEKMYGIPVINYENFKKHNPKTFAFYRKVSAARNL